MGGEGGKRVGGEGIGGEDVGEGCVRVCVWCVVSRWVARCGVCSTTCHARAGCGGRRRVVVGWVERTMLKAMGWMLGRMPRGGWRP